MREYTKGKPTRYAETGKLDLDRMKAVHTEKKENSFKQISEVGMKDGYEEFLFTPTALEEEYFNNFWSGLHPELAEYKMKNAIKFGFISALRVPECVKIDSAGFKKKILKLQEDLDSCLSNH